MRTQRLPRSMQAQTRVGGQPVSETSKNQRIKSLTSVTSVIPQVEGFKDIIGKTTVQEIGANNLLVPLEVYVAKVQKESNDYFLVDAQSNILGTTRLHLYKKGENRNYGVDCEYQIFPGAVYVENMESLSDNCKGVGTRLHQIAIEIAELAGYGTRVLLDAEKSSHVFHYKFGFRPMSEKYWRDEERIEREIEIAERKVRKGLIESIKEHGTSHLGPIPMYLPEDKNTISKIKSSPNILRDKTLIVNIFS